MDVCDQPISLATEQLAGTAVRSLDRDLAASADPSLEPGEEHEQAPDGQSRLHADRQVAALLGGGGAAGERPQAVGEPLSPAAVVRAQAIRGPARRRLVFPKRPRPQPRRSWLQTPGLRYQSDKLQASLLPAPYTRGCRRSAVPPTGSSWHECACGGRLPGGVGPDRLFG